MNPGKLVGLALIAQLLGAPVTSGMLVLCVGSDGHVAVESVRADLCCREWESAHRAGRGDHPSAVESASGPCCDDVELSIEAATLTGPSPKLLAAGVLPCSVLLPGPPLRASSAGTFSLSTESPVAASLRTVVLRA